MSRSEDPVAYPGGQNFRSNPDQDPRNNQPGSDPYQYGDPQRDAQDAAQQQAYGGQQYGQQSGQWSEHAVDSSGYPQTNPQNHGGNAGYSDPRYSNEQNYAPQFDQLASSYDQQSASGQQTHGGQSDSTQQTYAQNQSYGNQWQDNAGYARDQNAHGQSGYPQQEPGYGQQDSGFAHQDNVTRPVSAYPQEYDQRARETAQPPYNDPRYGSSDPYAQAASQQPQYAREQQSYNPGEQTQQPAYGNQYGGADQGYQPQPGDGYPSGQHTDFGNDGGQQGHVHKYGAPDQPGVQFGGEAQARDGSFAADSNTQDYFSQPQTQQDQFNQAGVHQQAGQSGQPGQGSELHFDARDNQPTAYFDQSSNFSADATQGQNFGIGDQQGRDAEFFPPVEEDTAYEEQRSGGRRGLIVVGALVAAVGIGGALGFAYKFSSGSGSGNGTPVISADQGPIKARPAEPGGKTFDNQNKSVYNQLNDGTQKAGARLGSNSSGTLSTSDLGLGNNAGQGTNGTRNDVSGVRRVQTVRVNPDGTFTRLPSLEQDVQRVPSPTARAQPSNGISIPGITIEGLTTTQVPSGDAARLPKQKVTSLPKPVVVPKPRVQVSTTPRKTANNALRVVKPTTRSTSSSASGLGGYLVQVSARRNRLDALAAFADLQQKYPQVLQNRLPDIQAADLSGQGTWYRLRIGPPGSKQAASDLCFKLKASGLKDCFVKPY